MNIYEVEQIELLLIFQEVPKVPYSGLVRIVLFSSYKEEIRERIASGETDETILFPYIEEVLNSGWKPSPQWPFTMEEMVADFQLAKWCHDFYQIWSLYEPEELDSKQTNFMSQMDKGKECWMKIIRLESFWNEDE